MKPEHLELMQAALEGQLKDEEHPKFNQILKENPELRKEFLTQCRLVGLLKASNGQLVTKESPSVKSRKLTPLYLWTAYAAALIFLSISLWKGWLSPEQIIEDLAPGPIARIVASDQPDILVGTHLLPGIYQQSQGNIHLMMDSGAEVILSGECKARLDHAMKMHLEQGKASVKVPPPARGFKFTTESMSIHDLGTSFGVDTKHAGHEVHVFEGKVIVTPASLEAGLEKELSAGQAASVQESELNLLTLNPEVRTKFPREFTEPQPIETPYVHYSFDGHLKDSGTQLQAYHAKPHKDKILANSLPWMKGKFKNSLFLNRKYWLQTDYKGVSGHAPRSVSLWMKVQPGQSFKQAASILAWGHGKNSQKKWQIMLDGTANGTLRVSLGNGHVSGSTDLQDGRWHHVCAVFLGGENADIRTHLRLYVDGKLEQLKRMKFQYINTGNENPMIIGQNLTHFNKKEHIFKGLIDELYIFEEALHPNQINLLYENNELPQPAAF